MCFYLGLIVNHKVNYFLRARAPAAATETTARATAAPTKSLAPIGGFTLLSSTGALVVSSSRSMSSSDTISSSSATT